MIEKRESPQNELLTVRDYIRWGCSRFYAAQLYFGHGTDNAWDEATHLVLHSLHLPWDINPEVLNARLTMDERKAVIAVIELRVQQRIPAAYITGEAWFAGLKFRVDERVLVPRSPIAELIEQQFEPWLTAEPQRILDLCTGSGCIGIACAYAFPDAQVDLSDISTEALEVARRNIADHHLEERARAVHSDLFSALTGARYDLIVSNPPYVNAEDLAQMPDEYRAEPSPALGSGVDGLDITRRILREASAHLTGHGTLIVELGNSWASLEDVYPRVPFTWLEFERGGHGVFLLSAAQLREYAADFAA